MREQFFVASFSMLLFTAVACIFALRWELAERGVSTLQGRWSVLRLWRSAIALPGPKVRIMVWGSLMWVCVVLTMGMLPVGLYFLYKAITA